MDTLSVSMRLGSAPAETEPMMTPPATRIDPRTFGPWAIVTGASSGIGEEFARQLAASGLNLALVARRRAALESLGSELARTFGVRYRSVELDLTDDDFIGRLADATRDLDIGLVISNAGSSTTGDFLTVDQRVWEHDLRLNTRAHLDLAHHFGQHLAQRKRGGLLLVSSTAALQGIPFSAEYSAAKAYVRTLGEALHVEFQRAGVHVTVLLPGATDTPLLAASGFDPKRLPVKPMSAQQCVAEGLAALSANHATHIAGRLNRILAAAMPRPLAIRMYGSLTRQLMRKRDASTAA